MEEKKIFLHSLCKLPVGHDKPWTHHWLRLISVEWCKWWQIPSSLIMCVQLIGVTHRDGHALALGWGAELPDWIIQKWPVIRLLSGRSALSSGRASVHLYSLLQCVCWWKHIIPICHRMSVSIPFRSYMCRCLAEDCAFDISVARRQSNGRCHFCVPNQKISLWYSHNISTWM